MRSPARLKSVVVGVTTALDNYDSHQATQHLTGFVEDLSNWYGEPGAAARSEFYLQARRMQLDSYQSKADTEPLTDRLWRRYGRRGFAMLESIREDPAMADDVMGSVDYIRVELHSAARSEMVTKLEDFMRRRSKIELVVRDEDIHAAVAAQIAGTDIAAVTPEMRRQAKAVNFGIIYGLSPYGLSRSIGVTVEEAERFIQAYFERYPGVERFIGELLSRARAEGHVTTILGRRRRVAGIRRRDRAGREAAPNHSRSAAERIAINTVVQGSAADLIKVAMNRIHDRVRRERRPARMLLQIHDELVFEVPEEALEAERRMIVEEMTGAWSLSVPLKVTTGAGRNWLEAG